MCIFFQNSTATKLMRAVTIIALNSYVTISDKCGKERKKELMNNNTGEDNNCKWK